MRLNTVSIGFGIDDDGYWKLFNVECICDLKGVSSVLVVEDSALYKFLEMVMGPDYQDGRVVRELEVGGAQLLRMEKQEKDLWVLSGW